MSALSNYVNLTITQTTVGVTRAGFGLPLVLSYTAAFPERVRLYNTIADVAVDFATTTSAEYRAAQALFAQSPRPPTIAIGRAALKPTIAMSLSAVGPTTNVTYQYKLTVGGHGFAEQTITFTSDGTPTDAEYAAGIVSALNATVGKNFTATGSTSPVTITGNAAGNYFYVMVDDPTTQKIKYSHADPGTATDLTAIALENPSFYALHVQATSKAVGVAAADWIESNNRIYLCESCDTESITTAITNVELLDQMRANGYTRSAGMYHPHPGQQFCAALFGRCLPRDPGSVTFFGKTLVGVTSFPKHMTATHRANLVARRAGGYESVDGTGLSVTFGTSVPSTSVGFLDVTRNLDWLKDDMTKEVFGIIIANDIVPMTNRGTAAIESGVRTSLSRAFRMGITAAPPAKGDVTIPATSTISTQDKLDRVLRNVNFSAVTSGAIHSVLINGQVS